MYSVVSSSANIYVIRTRSFVVDCVYNLAGIEWVRCMLNPMSILEMLSLLEVPMLDASWSDCDVRFQSILQDAQTQIAEAIVTSKPDSLVYVAGATFVELIELTFWTDPLLFYEAVLSLLDLFLRQATHRRRTRPMQ